MSAIHVKHKCGSGFNEDIVNNLKDEILKEVCTKNLIDTVT